MLGAARSRDRHDREPGGAGAGVTGGAGAAGGPAEAGVGGWRTTSAGAARGARQSRATEPAGPDVEQAVAVQPTPGIGGGEQLSGSSHNRWASASVGCVAPPSFWHAATTLPALCRSR